MRRLRGFSLLELLVALAVFSIMAALAYRGLNAVIVSVDVIEDQQHEARTLHAALMQMQHDLSMSTDRAVRDRLGGQHEAFVRQLGGDLFHLTRLGRANPYQQPVSQLKRVGWRLHNGALQRAGWAPVDGDPLASLPDNQWQTLADGIASVELRLFDDQQRAQSFWPVPGVDAPLPLAVEIVVQPEHGPDLQLTVALPEPWPDLHAEDDVEDEQGEVTDVP